MISQNAVKYGVFAGVAGIVIAILMYLMGPEFLSSSMWSGMLVGLSSLVVTIVLLIVFGTKMRKEEGGYITFGKMFLSLIVVVAVMVGISTVFSILLYQVIDPEFMATAKQMALENFAELEDRMTEKQFEDMMTRIEDGYSMSIGKSLMQIVWGILGWGS